MKKIILAISVALLFSALAGAVACDSAGVPGSAIFSSGVNQNFSCSFGGLTFSNFSFQNAGNDATPSIFFISTTTDAAGDVFFSFNPSLAVGPTYGYQTQDIEFTFAVVTTHAIGFADLTVNGSFGTVTEHICSTAPTVGGVCNNSTDLTPVNGLANSTGLPNRVVALTPAANGLFYVTKDIQVVAPSGQVGAISNVTESFDVPEPGTLIFLGSGLLGFGLYRRRRTNS
jgi:hypothetical protein